MSERCKAAPLPRSFLLDRREHKHHSVYNTIARDDVATGRLVDGLVAKRR